MAGRFLVPFDSRPAAVRRDDRFAVVDENVKLPFGCCCRPPSPGARGRSTRPRVYLTFEEAARVVSDLPAVLAVLQTRCSWHRPASAGLLRSCSTARRRARSSEHAG